MPLGQTRTKTKQTQPDGDDGIGDDGIGDDCIEDDGIEDDYLASTGVGLRLASSKSERGSMMPINLIFPLTNKDDPDVDSAQISANVKQRFYSRRNIPRVFTRSTSTNKPDATASLSIS